MNKIQSMGYYMLLLVGALCAFYTAYLFQVDTDSADMTMRTTILVFVLALHLKK